MKVEEGIAEIEAAQWVKDDSNTMNLMVHDQAGDGVLCWLALRPPYCDRGHIQLNVEGPLSLGIDGADGFPRYFFSFREADAHTRTFLKWRLWKERTHPHRLEVE